MDIRGFVAGRCRFEAAPPAAGAVRPAATGHRNSPRLWTIVLLMVLCSVPAASIVRAAARTLDQISIVPGPDGNEIHVDLTRPLQYISHAPLAGGQELEVQLRIVAGGAEAADDDTLQRESLPWRSSDDVPLQEVSYARRGPRSGALVLKFSRAVQYRVRGGADFRSIVVVLAPSAAGHGSAPRGARPADAPVPTPPPAARVMAPAPPDVPSPPEPGPSEAAPAKGERPPPVADLSNRYALNLLSSREEIAEADVPDLAVLDEYQLYITRFEKDGARWNRLRLGFFATKEDAEAVRSTLAEAFPDAWVTRVSRNERQRVAEQAAAPAGAVTARPEGPGAEPAESGEKAAPAVPQSATAKDPADLMKEAAAAVTANDLRRAIQLYTKILRLPDHPYRQEAQELLGLARERNNQLAHAKAEYEEYLRLYPEGEGADRVRQRLAGLLTARATPKERLQAAEAAEPDALDWRLQGSLSQLYSHAESFTDIEGRTVDQSELGSDLDLTGRVRDDRFDASLRVSGGHVLDTLESGTEQEERLSALYADALDSGTGLFARIGRQSRSTGGVLGRFDGGLLSAEVAPWAKINGVAGFPVATTNGIELDTDRYFYGLSLDLGTFADHWDGNVFAVNQEVDGITDRRSVGGEVRYIRPNLTAFGLLDYDIYFNSLNIALLTGTYIFPDQTTLNLSVDQRNSPILTATNALQGQGVGSVSDLLNVFSEDEVQDLAQDRTATSRSLSVGASRPLDERFQVGGEVTMTELSDTETSGGVVGTPGTGLEFFYSAQLIGSSIVKDGDIAILDLRFADTDRFYRYTVDVNTRYPVDRTFRVSPRIRTDLRDNKADDGTQVSVKPSLQLIYYWNRALQLEFNAGGEWTNTRLDDQSDDTLGFFVIAGYRYDF